jgi:hypothetical protein
VVISPWIYIVNGRLNQGDCALLMMGNTTAEGWMEKSNFLKPHNDPIQATNRINGVRHYAKLFIDVDLKSQSQWFA